MREPLNRLEPLRHVRADPLEIAYFETGPPGGEVTLLLHGFPYDIHSYVDVIPRLAAAGQRVIVPYLRGHGHRRSLRRRAGDATPALRPPRCYDALRPRAAAQGLRRQPWGR